MFKKMLKATLLAFAVSEGAVAHAKDITLLNVSYDPPREFYLAFNPIFINYW